MKPFDATRYLDSEAAMAEYLAAARDAGDPELLRLTLLDVARARGQTAPATAPATDPAQTGATD